MFKDVAVIVDGNNGKAGAYASSLAALLGAHLTTIAVNIGSDFEDFAAAEPRYDMIVAERENQEEATNKAVEQIRSEALGEGVDVTSLWLDNVGDGGLVRLDEMTRTFDLVVMDQASPDKPSERTRLIHSIVLKSGRPVLLVPYIQTRRAHFSCVLVAWDGSAPAARALGDAMPLLERADRVELVRIDGSPAYDIAGSAVRRHLSRHAIDATFRRTSSAGDTGATLLSQAADASADLLVMGAYGHTPLREALFGGTTRTVLRSMTMPVLMSR